MKRIELCSQASQIGCGIVVFFLGGSTLTLAFMAPATLWMLAIYAPLGFVFWAMVRGFYQSIGKVLEVSSTGALLLNREQVEWQFNWEQLLSVTQTGNIDLVFSLRDGTSHCIPIGNVPTPTMDQLRVFLPAGVEYERKSPEFLTNIRFQLPIPALAGVIVTGVIAFAWGGHGILEALHAFRNPDLVDASSVDMKMIGAQSVALIAGTFAMVLSGGALTRRLKPPAKSVTKEALRLDSYIHGAQDSPLAHQTVIWKSPDRLIHKHRNEGREILGCTIFWICALSGVIWFAIGWPRGQFLVWPYAAIVLFHLYVAWLWTRQLNGQDWTVQTSGDSIWVTGPQGSFPATVKKPLGKPQLELSIDGKHRTLDPKHFYLERPEKQALSEPQGATKTFDFPFSTRSSQ